MKPLAIRVAKPLVGRYDRPVMKKQPNRPPKIGLVAAFVIACFLVGMTVHASLAANEGSGLVQEASATPSGGFQFPTATQTLVGAPTSTPTRTPTSAPVQARVIGDPTNLRDGPGLDFEIIAELTPGEVLPIVGRWLGTDWLQITWEEGPEGKAWVYAPLVIVEGDITTVPAVEPPPPPTQNPTVVAAQATATILLQTPGAVETATVAALEAQLQAPQGIITVTPAPGTPGGGNLPTFTPPPPGADSANIQPLIAPTQETASGGIPPAVLIIGLGVMGGLSLLLAVLRRLL